MNHFGRFRVINHTGKSTNDKPATVTKATITVGQPAVLKTVIGFGTQFPMLPPGYYADLDLEPGLIFATAVNVMIELDTGTGTLSIPTWDLFLGPGPADAATIELRGVDIKLDYKLDGTDIWRARATIAGSNFEFDEPNWKTFT